MVGAQARSGAQGRRQRLLQRGGVGLRPVAALVKPAAGRIDIQRRLIFHQGELDLVQRARLLEPRDLILRLQPLHHRFFDDGLAVADAEQVGIERIALHREAVGLADPFLPRQRLHALKELLEGVGLKRAHQDQDALREARADAGPRQDMLVAGKQHPAVFRLYVLRFHFAQLVRDQSLQPQQAGDAVMVRHTSLLICKRVKSASRVKSVLRQVKSLRGEIFRLRRKVSEGLRPYTNRQKHRPRRQARISATFPQSGKISPAAGGFHLAPQDFTATRSHAINPAITLMVFSTPSRWLRS